MKAENSNAEILCKKITSCLSTDVNIAEIYTFGSLNTGKSDQFSDVDITVVTGNLKATSSQLDSLLNQAGAVDAVLTIFEEPKSAAYTYFLDGWPPYQKIDIDIRPLSGYDLFENSKRVYMKQSVIEQETNVKTKNQSDPDKALLNCLVGSLRYLKHIQRGETWAAYKFYRGFIEQFLLLHRGRYNDSLALEDYKQLEDIIPTDLFLNHTFDDMHATYSNYLASYVSLIGNKIDRSNSEFAQKMLRFWKNELTRIVQNGGVEQP